MQIAKISTAGQSQTVHLPQAFQFNVSEVVVKHFGSGVLLLPKENAWQTMQDALAEFEADFSITREEQSEQIREKIL